MKLFPIFYRTLQNGETLAYRQGGSGSQVLLLVHGNMSSSVHFQGLMEKLENDYLIYAVDMRGFGESSYNCPFDSLSELADDLIELMDALHIESAALLGWSTGGGVVMEMAARIPKRIKSILLLSSVCVTGYPMFRKDAAGAPILTERLSSKEDIAADPVQVVPALEAYKVKDREYFRYLWNLVIYNLKQPPAEEYERYLDAILQQRNLVDIDYSLVHFNVTDASNGVAPGSGTGALIACPITLLHGAKDRVVPLAMAQESKAYFGDRAELVVFEEYGHSIVTDGPDDLAAAIKRHA